MRTAQTASFTPPTPQQVHELIERHPAHAPSPWASAWPWAVVLVLVVLSAAVPAPGLSLLPWLGLAGAFAWFAWQRRQFTQLTTRTQDVQALATLRRDAQALRDAWRLLPKLTRMPPLFGSTVFVIGECLDRLRCYEQAIVVYDHLIDRLPEDGSDAAMIRLRRAMAELQCDRLLDADDTLRRMKGAVEAGQFAQPVPALYRLAELMQQVHTHHYAEAMHDAPRLVRQLRPLGVTAGYGFALAALACRMLQDHAQVAGADDAARRWWSRATLLVPVTRLTERFPAVGVLAEATHE